MVFLFLLFYRGYVRDFYLVLLENVESYQCRVLLGLLFRQFPMLLFFGIMRQESMGRWQRILIYLGTRDLILYIVGAFKTQIPMRMAVPVK
jgi:hypothetical protein